MREIWQKNPLHKSLTLFFNPLFRTVKPDDYIDVISEVEKEKPLVMTTD
jgi:hypothetical protein